ncbi:TPA: polyprenyl synthetase family protein, partial [Candidatus Poribacteria bacterium]|nr:polyprenyl synthetase family protein [Candidatus Poribacteria bacterium]
MAGSAFEYLNETKKQIDSHIRNFLPTVHKNPEIKFFYQLMRDYPMRSGKRLRPAFCFLACEMFGGKIQDAIHTATALELLQSWLLIHDDIEDESILRRGEPCLHHQHGIPMAVNVGDALHCKMWEMLNQNVSLLGYELSFKILSEFIQLSNRVVEGQHIELSWMQEKRWDVSDEDYWMMCVQKTAWYTCITPCRLGALISGSVQPDQLEQFIHIGTDLGVAFQIQDDVLNLIGEEG